MKRVYAGILTAGILFAGSAFAVIYQYTNDSGHVHYTNEFSSVPASKRQDIIKFKEYKSKTVPKNTSLGFRSSPSPSNASNFTKKSLSFKNHAHRKKLEAEYNTLLKEKKNLDNNASFQKRRKKRKYQNRPYIQELIKKEERLIKRISELTAELKAFEKP